MSEFNSILDKPIEKEVTKLIVPFMFSDSPTEIQLNSDHWTSETFSMHRLLSNIRGLIVQQDELLRQKKLNLGSAIGTRMKLTQQGRKQYNLPQNTTSLFSMTAKGKTYSFGIREIELLYFETQVGFLVFELTHNAKSTLNDIIEADYYCKNISPEGATLSYLKGKDKEVCELSMYGLTTSLLTAFQITGYFEEDSDKLRPNRALVYNCAVIACEPAAEDKFLKDIGHALFLMRRSFKESYRPAPDENQLSNNEEVVRFFDNSYWGVSLEGAANLSYLIDDNDGQDTAAKETNAFFQTTFIGHLKNTYFYLYMLTLHQKYALQKFATDTSGLSQSLEDEALQQNIEDLQRNITFFNLRCLFKEISGVSHHRVLYRKFQQVLGIREQLDELKVETESLSSLHKQLKEKKRKKIEEREKGIRDFLFIILSIVGLSSTVNAIFSIYKYTVDPAFPGITDISFDILLGIITIVVLAILANSIRLARLTHNTNRTKKKSS